MVTDKLVLSVQMFLMSVFLSVWYGDIVPEFAARGLINFACCGVVGAILLAATALLLYWYKNPGIIIRIVFLIINLICILLIIIPSFPVEFYPGLMIFAAIFQGFILGSFLQQSLKNSILRVNVSFLGLGATGVLIARFLPYKLSTFNTAHPEASGNTWENIAVISVLVMTLLIIGVFNFRPGSVLVREIKKSTVEPTLSALCRFMVVLNIAILVLIEIIFSFWSLILINANQSIASSLTFPLSVIIVFTFRFGTKEFIIKMADIGWLFTLSVILTISLGLFYTFDFTPAFILGAGFSMAYLVYINHHLFNITITIKNLAYLLVAGSVVMVIIGLFTQNHIEFIRSINIPEDVITLSARQALVKELASFAAISVIISGYLFLKRRSIFDTKSLPK